MLLCGVYCVLCVCCILCVYCVLSAVYCVYNVCILCVYCVLYTMCGVLCVAPGTVLSYPIRLNGAILPLKLDLCFDILYSAQTKVKHPSIKQFLYRQLSGFSI